MRHRAYDQGGWRPPESPTLLDLKAPDANLNSECIGRMPKLGPSLDPGQTANSPRGGSLVDGLSLAETSPDIALADCGVVVLVLWCTSSFTARLAEDPDRAGMVIRRRRFTAGVEQEALEASHCFWSSSCGCSRDS